MNKNFERDRAKALSMLQEMSQRAQGIRAEVILKVDDSGQVQILFVEGSRASVSALMLTAIEHMHERDLDAAEEFLQDLMDTMQKLKADRAENGDDEGGKEYVGNMDDEGYMDDEEDEEEEDEEEEDEDDIWYDDIPEADERLIFKAEGGYKN